MSGNGLTPLTNASLISVQGLTNSIQQLISTELTNHFETFLKKQELFQEEIRTTNAAVMQVLGANQAGPVRSLFQDPSFGQGISVPCGEENGDFVPGERDENKPEARRSIRTSGRVSIMPVVPGSAANFEPESSVTLGTSVTMTGSGSQGAVSRSTQERATNKMLVKMVSRNLEDSAMSLEPRWSCSSIIRDFIALNVRSKVLRIDAVMGIFITSNAISIGFSMDNEGPFWDALDMCFSVLFLCEFILKIFLLGLQGYFCGKGAVANWGDTVLVTVDWAQFVAGLLSGDKDGEDSPIVSLFRIARLVRLVRLARLLRLAIFQDLVSMITGLAGGLTTLIWSIALFFIIVYVCALLFREFFGRTSREHISVYFDSVPRSMFTVFRCSFGDCSSKDGLPIFEHVTLQYGGLFSVVYCIFTFTIVVGLFNVISAIFVESTMAAAIESKLVRKQERLLNNELWENSVSVLMLAFLEYTGRRTQGGGLKEQINDLVEGEINMATFRTWITDTKVIKALNDLDINPDDHPYLFDIFDCDNAGGLAMSELVDGLARLRGEPRRSDIITIDLMVRSIQTQMDQLVSNMDSVVKHCGIPPKYVSEAHSQG